MRVKQFYQKELYPLQDEVLAVVEMYGKDFYLTGGTALHRFYGGCRYSDDLDFFSRRQLDNFREEVSLFLRKFSDRGLECKTGSFSDTFARLLVGKGKARLKVDFVNDPIFRYGALKKFKPFARVDNEINILTNKITAISRYEAKDIVDVWFISKKRRFLWRDIFKIASRKSPVDPLDVSRIIKEMPKKELKVINWSKKVDLNSLYRDLQVIAADIVKGE